MSAEAERLAETIDALLGAFEGHPDPRVRDGVAALTEALRRLHGEGLRRLLALLAEDRARLARALADPLIADLLLLHDLAAPDDPRTAAEAALAPVRAMAAAHGGRIEVLDAAEGVVRLRLEGACRDCPSSQATLRHGVEQALREHLSGWGIEVEGPPPQAPPGAPAPAGAAHSRVALARLDALPAHGLHGALIEGHPVLVLRTERGAVRAYRNACPGSILPLHLGTLEDGAIRCPWHGCRFDAATGRRLGAEGPPLAALPVTVGADGTVRVGLR